MATKTKAIQSMSDYTEDSYDWVIKVKLQYQRELEPHHVHHTDPEKGRLLALSKARSLWLETDKVESIEIVEEITLTRSIARLSQEHHISGSADKVLNLSDMPTQGGHLNG